MQTYQITVKETYQKLNTKSEFLIQSKGKIEVIATDQDVQPGFDEPGFIIGSTIALNQETFPNSYLWAKSADGKPTPVVIAE